MRPRVRGDGGDGSPVHDGAVGAYITASARRIQVTVTPDAFCDTDIYTQGANLTGAI